MGLEWLFGFGTLVLGAALAYGVSRSSRRDPRNEQITEQATREQYQTPDRYDDDRREQLARQTH